MSIPETIPEDLEENRELSPIEFLRDLSNRIMNIAVMHGVDQYDCDRLNEIATNLEKGGNTK